jgi:phosphoglycolate phosphatase
MNGRKRVDEAPGVVFDLDGTLADTLRDISDAVKVSLEHFALPVQPLERVRAFIGDGLPQLMSRAAGTNDPDRVAGLVERFRDYYSLNYLRHTHLYPGMEEAVSALRRAGCPISVLSNKPHDSTQRICNALRPAGSLDAVAGASDEYPKKPDPTAALLLAERMGRPPQRVVMVGDSAIDVQTARNAGMRCVAVTWGFRDRPELEAARPDAIVDRPEQLPLVILGR